MQMKTLFPRPAFLVLCSSPLLSLPDPDERGAVLGVRPELVARLDHVVAEILVVGHHLPLEAQLLGGDVVVEQDLGSHGWKQKKSSNIYRRRWPGLDLTGLAWS